MDLGSVCRYWAKRHPDSVAMRFDGVEMTWHQLDRETDDLAACLAALGVVAGQSVAVVASPSGQCCQMMIGAMKLGVAMLVFDPGLPGDRVSDLIAHRTCPVVVTDNLRPGLVGSIQERCPGIVEVRLGSNFNNGCGVSVLRAGAEARPARTSANADAIIIYRATSSGIRSVALSHRDVLLLASSLFGHPIDRFPELALTPEQAKGRSVDVVDVTDNGGVA
jgi:acyl-CoA synthetase (AMP-forming)/AMP-acid ligase II